jgi:hypothetical protein
MRYRNNFYKNVPRKSLFTRTFAAVTTVCLAAFFVLLTLAIHIGIPILLIYWAVRVAKYAWTGSW